MKFLIREVELVDIGEYTGTRLFAQVERRGVRASFGGAGRGFSFRIERLHPVAIEASGAGAPREHSLEVSRDPWLHGLLGMLVLWALSVVVTTLTARLRARARR
jgi:hypothetical protein